MPTGTVDVNRFMTFLGNDLERSAIKDRIETEMTLKANAEREGIFIRSFLCPSICSFFYSKVREELGLLPEAIKTCLGTEDFKRREGFGFAPAIKRNQLFTKSDVVRSTAPDLWRKTSAKKLSELRASPDFAIRKPLLPISIVGEVKYFTGGSPEAGIQELYNAARQAMFYLAALHNTYDAAMIVIADASPKHFFFEGLDMLRPELLSRFGQETNVYLLAIRLH